MLTTTSSITPLNVGNIVNYDSCLRTFSSIKDDHLEKTTPKHGQTHKFIKIHNKMDINSFDKIYMLFCQIISIKTNFFVWSQIPTDLLEFKHCAYLLWESPSLNSSIVQDGHDVVLFSTYSTSVLNSFDQIGSSKECLWILPHQVLVSLPRASNCRHIHSEYLNIS